MNVKAGPAALGILADQCDGGNARACGVLGVALDAAGRPGGDQFLRRACEGGDAYACAVRTKSDGT